MAPCLGITVPKDYTAVSLIRTRYKTVIVTTRNVSLLAFITLLGAHAALASNVMIDMSQVQDYTQYQIDLQQYGGLALQNQPDAPQRESVADTAARVAAVRPAPMPARRPIRS